MYSQRGCELNFLSLVPPWWVTKHPVSFTSCYRWWIGDSKRSRSLVKVMQWVTGRRLASSVEETVSNLLTCYTVSGTC
jgi:hypothetical protein